MTEYRIALFSPEVIDMIERRRPGRKAGKPGNTGPRNTDKSEVAKSAAAAIKSGACPSVEEAAEMFAEAYLGRAGSLTKDQLRYFRKRIKNFL
ncbi:hypothetical protein [Sinirhodobacter huangdaonensis]|uniref:Uncharacterized protein n=1 Tax=Paenirhodobacter huangdaonensis TaxID=2501515 RepID=A0A443LXN9_9RHOB|nr:hypothetical protein [Sinirhodobacter huangdaonensis]RWR54024.1 hypothetical protein EOW66_05275 [Sinirhodobacter huangdaonensis]